MDPQNQAANRMVMAQLEARGITDPAVLDAMRAVPRHVFVPDIPIEQAYADKALPTTAGQTISQPYIVAKMTELLALQPGMSVLEIGTGTGYQTAVLAQMGANVVTIERSAELLGWARQTLAQACPQADIRMLLADGSLGDPKGAPFDRILVTAAAPHIPKACREQLADPGRLVIPIGNRHSQNLCVLKRHGDRFTLTDDLACRFVPLIGQDAWPQ